jgi:hypothetical protein
MLHKKLRKETMKVINFCEYRMVLHTYYGDVEISDEDYKSLESKNLSMEDIMNKYELNFSGDWNECENDDSFDGIEWIQE